MALNNSKRTYASFSEPYGPSSIFSDPLPTSKRPRADDEPSLWNQILSLPHTTTQTLLYQICSANPSLSSFIQSAHNARLAEEAARPPVNFDHYSRDCWYTMNKKYKNLSFGKQFRMMGDICQVLDESREAIVGAAGPDVRWETRRNALEVLRKICKSIVLCDEPQIRHELMKDGFMLGQFADSMQELAGGMSQEEKERYKAEGLYDKLMELQQECGPDDMEGLPEVYRIFEGTDKESEDDNEEREQEEDQDRDADAIEEAHEQYNNCGEDQDEEEYLEEEEDVGTVAGFDTGARRDGPYAQRIGLGEEVPKTNLLPSQPQRTNVFSIGELS